MDIVTNTSPLIMLAKIDQLGLLPQLFTTVSIPIGVYRELIAKSGVEAQRLEFAFSQFVEIREKPEFPPVVQTATKHLDPGEQQAIALAYLLNRPLVIDERLGRQAARLLGVQVTGSVGVLLQAKRQNLVPLVMPLLYRAREQGYWLSDELLAIAANEAQEIE
jgi:uncharacterized protein